MGNDSNKKEQDVTITININKKCYSQGENITGFVFLRSNPGSNKTEWINPTGRVTLWESHRYIYEDVIFDETKVNFHIHDIGNDEDNNKSIVDDGYRKVKKEEKKSLELFSKYLDLSKYNRANLLNGVQIPFSFKIPKCHPTCYFNDEDYVSHFLYFHFSNIDEEKSIYIVIKNSQNYTVENKLYKSPAIEDTTKYKNNLFFKRGHFTASLTLPKNSFGYDDNIPFELNIDCSQLSVNMKGVEFFLLRIEKKNEKEDESKIRSEIKKQTSIKKYKFDKGQPKYLVKDYIQFPIIDDFYPIKLYDILDRDPFYLDKNKKKILLAPACIGGLLSVDYFIVVEFKIDSIFSKDESFRMPIDFYVPYNIQQNEKVNNPTLNQPYNYNQGKIDTNNKKNITNNNIKNENINNIKINQKNLPANNGQNTQGNINNNNRKNNINNNGYQNNNRNIVMNIYNNKNQNININNNKNQNVPLNINNKNKHNVRINQPTNNINNNYYGMKNLPQNNNNNMPNNMRVNQPINNLYNNYNLRINQPVNNMNMNNFYNHPAYNQNIYYNQQFNIKK